MNSKLKKLIDAAMAYGDPNMKAGAAGELTEAALAFYNAEKRREDRDPIMRLRMDVGTLRKYDRGREESGWPLPPVVEKALDHLLDWAEGKLEKEPDSREILVAADPETREELLFQQDHETVSFVNREYHPGKDKPCFTQSIGIRRDLFDQILDALANPWESGSPLPDHWLSDCPNLSLCAWHKEGKK